MKNGRRQINNTHHQPVQTNLNSKNPFCEEPTQPIKTKYTKYYSHFISKCNNYYINLQIFSLIWKRSIGASAGRSWRNYLYMCILTYDIKHIQESTYVYTWVMNNRKQNVNNLHMSLCVYVSEGLRENVSNYLHMFMWSGRMNVHTTK